MSLPTPPPPCMTGETAHIASESASSSSSSSSGSSAASTSTSTSGSSNSPSDVSTFKLAAAPTCGSSSSNEGRPQAKSKKQRKEKETVSANGNEGKVPRRRLEWNSLPRALAILEEHLVEYQKLDSDVDEDKKSRSKLKKKVADMILEDPELKESFAAKGHGNEEVRKVRV